MHHLRHENEFTTEPSRGFSSWAKLERRGSEGAPGKCANETLVPRNSIPTKAIPVEDGRVVTLDVNKPPFTAPRTVEAINGSNMSLGGLSNTTSRTFG